MSPLKLFVALMGLFIMGCGVVGGLAQGLQRQDLELLCDVATTVQNDASVDQKTRMKEVAKRLGTKGAPAGLKAAWKAVEKAPPKLRKGAYNKMLKKAGLGGFECAPLEQLVAQ